MAVPLGPARLVASARSAPARGAHPRPPKNTRTSIFKEPIMQLSRLLHRGTVRAPKQPPASRRGFRPDLEAFERRTMLSADLIGGFTVNNLVKTSTATGTT